MNRCVLFLLLSLLLAGCGSLTESSKYRFVDGYYRTKVAGQRALRAYVVVSEDSIKAYQVRKVDREIQVDSSKLVAFSFPAVRKGPGFEAPDFRQAAFDVDVLTIPFKYRPAAGSLPPQLTANFTGAVYAGYRFDRYRLAYQPAPVSFQKRKITHYGYSFGLFTGIGSTAINPWVTENRVTSEYDGLAWNKGVAAIVGVNNLTFGLGIGVDHLLDRHRNVWIYQGKPWLGLTIGLNLN